MTLFTQSSKLLPLLLAGSLHTAVRAQTLALHRPAQQPEPAAGATAAPSARGTSLESVLQELKTKHHAFFLYRSELIKNKFVNVDALTFRTWEEKLNYVVAVSGLRIEKTDRNVYIISAPKKAGAALQTIGRDGAAGAETIGAAPVRVAATVRGKIVGPDNVPVPGVTVIVKNTTNGTATDVNGEFTLNVADGNETLVVTALGYVTQEISLQGRTQLNVTLQNDTQALDEVVVLGYTTEKKINLTGAVSQIDQRDINALPVTNVSQIIQGKAAGVAVTQNTGAPGEGIAVRIRGVNTISDNDPLYIIDGVPTKDGINQLSPNDIESINIVKDAASAALYGARASSGVVVVTTKRGKSGKPRLSVNAYTGLQTAANLIPMANTAQYVNAFNVAAQNDGRAPISPELAATLPDVNWLKEVLRPAQQHNVQVDLSGGSENTQYIVSGSYLTQDGLIRNSSYDRYNLRTGINGKLSKYFTLGTNANLSYSKTRQVGTSGDGFGAGNPGASIVRYALFRTPAIPVRNAQGQYVDRPRLPDGGFADGFFGDGINPVELADAADRNFLNYSIIGNTYAELTPVERLRIRTDFGTTFRIVDYKQFFPSFGIDRNFNSPPQLAQSNSKQFNYNWTNTATYDLALGKNNFTILFGTEALKFNSEAFSASRRGYINQSPTFQYLDSGPATSQQNGGGASHSSLWSTFGRLAYDYDGRYLASFNYRRDASSQFLADRRAETFFSGSAGWNLAQEAFMQNVTAFSQLKLRASLGQLGNFSIGDYPYASLVGQAGFYPFGGQSTQSQTITSTGNPNIRWERTTQTDLGLDVAVLANKLQLSLDYYVKNTDGVLLNLPLPTSAGGRGNPPVNIGQIQNRGLELELTYRNTIGKDWTYSLNGNVATLHNEVMDLGGAPPLVGARIDNNYFATRTDVGHSVGEFYLLQTDGIFQTAQEVFTSAYQGPDVKPGDIKFKDLSGPDGVPDGVIDGYDRTYVGSPLPKLTYGLTGNIAFKGFDLSVFFQGVYGNKIYNQVNTDIEGFYRPFNLTERAATNYWTGEGSTNEYPRLSWAGASNNKQPSDRFLESGSYLRLKNLQLGYTFGEKLLTPLRVQAVRLYFSVQNLLTFTEYTGLDPEQYTNSNSLGDGVRAVGIDWGTYPSARTFTLGINASF